jgi:uncharacterized protein
MTDDTFRYPSLRAFAVPAAVSLALLWATHSNQLIGAQLNVEPIRSIPYGRAALLTLSDTLMMLTLVSLAAWRSPLAVLGLSGIGASALRPALWSLLWFIPALVLCFALTRPAEGVRAEDVAWLSVGSPIFEELTFRGLAVGALLRLCGWPWWLACLWPAVFFGYAHFGQEQDAASIAGIVALTGIGGLLFGWLYVRWGFNLWPAIFLHIGLNGLWTVFDLGDNALGGWLGNVMRIGVIIIAIVATFWLAPPALKKDDAQEMTFPG